MIINSRLWLLQKDDILFINNTNIKETKIVKSIEPDYMQEPYSDGLAPLSALFEGFCT